MRKLETTFYLVRHGETEFNRDHLMQGHQDSPLTELGYQQALTLRKKFCDIKFDRVVSSDLKRAETTAKLIIGDRPIEFWTTPSLRERNYGPFEKQERTIYLNAVKLLPDKTLPPGVETTPEVQSRVLNFLEWAAWCWKGETMLVTSHGSAIKHSLVKLGVEKFDDPRLVLPNGSFYKLIFEGKKPRIAPV